MHFSYAGRRFMAARPGRELVETLAEMVEGEQPELARVVREAAEMEADSLDQVEAVVELIEAVERRLFGTANR